MINKKGAWIQTYTGRIFDFVQSRPDDISVLDIAVHLARIPRFVAATELPYNVAQHSVHVSELVAHRGGSEHEQLVGLLHDATEAYMLDVPKPLKRLLPDYCKIEKNVWSRISTHFFGEDIEISRVVKECDLAMLVAEAHDLFAYPPHANWPNAYSERASLKVKNWTEDYSIAAFLDRYEFLNNPSFRIAA